MSDIPLTRHTISIDGRKRIFWAYWPTIPIKAALIGCHGAGMTGRGFASGGNRSFDQQAEEGVACIFPNSGKNEEGNRAWQLDGPLYDQNRDFLHKLRLELLERGARGVGLLGNSSGGYNTWKFRVDDPHRDQGQFCWYAPGAANLPKTWAQRLLPAPTFIPHGTKDTTVPFDGSPGQLGWQAAVRAVATVNAGGTQPTDVYEDPVRSCARRTTTFTIPYISATAQSAQPGNWLDAAQMQQAQMVPVVGAKVDPGFHSWHACNRWQMQQQIIEWSTRLGLWVADPDYTTPAASATGA
jgi:poly(3-hydroxybutyrate) depolymerase